jgi:hypothetical protein
MAEGFLNLDEEDRLQTYLQGAAKLKLRPAVLEKDVWVCWVLRTLFEMPDDHRMAFKGGTSLSKVYDAIQRFSEDVDVTIHHRDLDERDPVNDSMSGNKRKELVELLPKLLGEYTRNVVKPNIEAALAAEFNDHAWVALDEAGEKMWVHYPSVTENDLYIEKAVLVEFGGRNVTEPDERHTIRPYVAGVLEAARVDVELPVAQVNVLSPIRTFWEKVTYIYALCSVGTFKRGANRLSRHWYDVAVLLEHDIGRRAEVNLDLMRDVVKVKNIFYRQGSANYGACLVGGLVLVPSGTMQDELEADYVAMTTSGMFYGSAPAFAEVAARLGGLAVRVNHMMLADKS